MSPIVNVSALAPTATASRHFLSRFHDEDDSVLLELEGDHSCVLDGEQLRQYARSAHGGTRQVAWCRNLQFAAPPCASFPSRDLHHPTSRFTLLPASRRIGALPPTCSESQNLLLRAIRASITRHVIAGPIFGCY